ncbi:hypothetical protein PoB_005728900 [Plakobranchus ocellatus]|uniref:EF-hand domain-containing protein n=1 Tax=Plakobranchus ocellatus TaxID=259542 RepID=A0AAV4CDS9_9GAST|nr:hypothetical protein PoB_005728900 [Plakobranchus ocellatus]
MRGKQQCRVQQLQRMDSLGCSSEWRTTKKITCFHFMWTCSFIPLTTYAFTPNHFVVLHNKLKSPVVDLTFASADDHHDDDSASATAAVACVGNDDKDDDTASAADISDTGTVDYDEIKLMITMMMLLLVIRMAISFLLDLTVYLVENSFLLVDF